LRYLIDEFEMDKQFSNQTRPKKCILIFFFGYAINKDKIKHSVKMKKCYMESRRRGMSHTHSHTHTHTHTQYKNKEG